jgi:hypothetical protein
MQARRLRYEATPNAFVVRASRPHDETKIVEGNHASLTELPRSGSRVGRQVIEQDLDRLSELGVLGL